MMYARHVEDGGVLLFDRQRGLNVLAEGGPFAGLRRRAPRTLLVSLLTECNLRCPFCYRDRRAESSWTRASLRELLVKAAEWGVVDVAFGGGEPLLFPELGELLVELYARTHLALSLTTNGTLLTHDWLDSVGSALSEIRISAYRDNHYRQTLERFAGRPIGVNWLVTPEDVGLVEPTVLDCLRLGARNVLLLGYKGDMPGVGLDESALRRLATEVRRLEGLPVRLDVCWTPDLAAPRLFTPDDCGAGDSFLMITPDRKAKACSFHDRAVPFESFEGLQAAWRVLRAERTPARVGGCTRERFRAARDPAPSSAPAPRPTLRVWQAFASNHSGSSTLLGRFATTEIAADVAREIREVFRAHLAYLATPEGKALEFDALQMPTPPLLELGKKWGFDWGDEDTNTFWWESMKPPRPGIDLTVVTEDTDVQLFHPYRFQFPEIGLTRYFAARGGSVLYSEPDGILPVRVTAHGVPPAASAALRAHLDALLAIQEFREQPGNEYGATPFDDTPPWGKVIDDPRFGPDEERHATLSEDCEQSLDVHGDALEAVLQFNQPFHGAVAVHTWLIAQGTASVDISYVGVAPRT